MPAGGSTGVRIPVPPDAAAPVKLLEDLLGVDDLERVDGLHAGFHSGCVTLYHAAIAKAKKDKTWTQEYQDEAAAAYRTAQFMNSQFTLDSIQTKAVYATLLAARPLRGPVIVGHEFERYNCSPYLAGIISRQTGIKKHDIIQLFKKDDFSWESGVYPTSRGHGTELNVIADTVELEELASFNRTILKPCTSEVRYFSWHKLKSSCSLFPRTGSS